MTVSFFAHPDPIVAWSYGLYVLVAFVSGIACGAVGIGGVFLTPTLILLHVNPKVAVGSVLTAFFPQAVVQCVIARQKIHRTGALCLCLGALPGAVGGALLLPVVPSSVITIIVAVVALGSGVNTLRQTLCVGEAKNGGGGPVVEAVEVGVEVGAVDGFGGGGGGGGGGGKAQGDNTPNGNKTIDNPPTTTQQQEDLAALFATLFVTPRERWTLVGIGVFSGFMSVMTSSGGPFATLPVLFICFKQVRGGDTLGELDRLCKRSASICEPFC